MNTARFSKYVWPFFIIMHERLRRIQNNLVENLKFKRVRELKVFDPVITHFIVTCKNEIGC